MNRPYHQKEPLGLFIEEHNTSLQVAYSNLPSLLKEHYGIEQTVLAGGYGYRQIMELIQNGADAILEANENNVMPTAGHRIDVLLCGSRLYVANTGAPLSSEGVETLLSSHSSPKRGNQIGRFGLGFKSLLRLGGIIDIFTKESGAIRFDQDRCRQELHEKFDVEEAPGLRLAWPLNEEERTADSVLSRFTWAETIVRVEICEEDFIEHLRSEIRSFPSEFLLFLPVPVRLQLDDGTNPAKELRVRPEGNERVLFAGKEPSRWHIVFHDVPITDVRALTDATHIHARKTIPLAWAIPLEGKRDEAGRFWAFFPTHTLTYVPGILNAPWKLNSDRNAIIDGEWNRVMMREAAQLIVETIPKLHANDDPGRILDAFPRQLERKDEDAITLVDALWTALESAAVIPDAKSFLRPAAELWRYPRESADLARQWQALANDDELAIMVHPSCLERQRWSRLNALADRLSRQDRKYPNLQRREVTGWFSAIAKGEFANAVMVLKLAEAYEKDCKPEEWKLIRPLLRIIPTNDGQLLTADRFVFAPEGTCVPDGRLPVARLLYEDSEAKRILTDVMKVKPLDDKVWELVLHEALNGVPNYPAEVRNTQWQAFWKQLRMAPPAISQRFITQYSVLIRTRRRDGYWALAEEVLLPGALVGLDDVSSNRSVLVDLTAHRGDEALLASLGICDCPDGVINIKRYDGVNECLSDWLRYWRSHYYNHINKSASWSYLIPTGLTLPKGWIFLPKLSSVPNAELTERFLVQYGRTEFAEKLKFGHCTVTKYPEIDVTHPLSWLLLKHGTVLVGEKTIRLPAVVARRHEAILTRLPNWEQLHPALGKLEGVTPSVPAMEADIRALWLALIKVFAIPSAYMNDSLRELWAGAAKDNVVPQSLLTETGEIPLAQVFVTGSPDLAQRAWKAGYFIITLDEHAIRLWLENGARNLSELMSPEFTEQTGPEGLLVSIIPELAEVLQDEEKATARCQQVSDLKLIIAEKSDPVPCLMWNNTLFLDAACLSSLSYSHRLQLLLAEVAAAGWLKYDPGKALDILGNAKVHDLRASVAKGSTQAERLLLAVGNRAEPLREALGNLASMDFIQKCTLPQLAELTLAQLGPAILTALKDTLEKEGLKPPSRWNTAEARVFVASIGFSEEFAASPDFRREPEEFISGPIDFPPLHDFQKEVFEGIRVLVTGVTTRRRAVVSLPTGGGKTRVTVEAAVVIVLKLEGDRRSVIWIAQTDELCEQAVQAFRQVWLNIGAKKTDLRIVRLWGGNPNPTIQEPDKPVVVVTSIQTLNSRMGANGLDWLHTPGLVVVDECHHAITPSYTKLLRWLDAEAPRAGVPPKDEPPILGLSATPFRTDDEESKRLARRFDNLWLPTNQEDLHIRLRQDGVLAEVDSEALESGVGLLPEEIDRLSRLTEPWEGIDFENLLETINQRLAKSEQRNKCLVDCIKAMGERSILLFANSVLHAEEMSARLNLQGITAAAVSGNTPTSARRYFLERFLRGEIRVLCNHTVLSTGFDAPKIDMILISRAVFSPVRYMQMVGRGLRGVKNGGTARCHIVTVVDNLGRFQDRHPYHYCRRYFTSGSEGI